jgi:hypothetical protein
MSQKMLKYICEDGHANVKLARLLAWPAEGADCECCAGARVWLALAVGLLVGWIL